MEGFRVCRAEPPPPLALNMNIMLNICLGGGLIITGRDSDELQVGKLASPQLDASLTKLSFSGPRASNTHVVLV